MLITKLVFKAKNSPMIWFNPQLGHAFKVESHLTVKERIALYNLSESKEIFLEIGSYLGASACCFGAAIKAAKKGRLICVDTWNNDAMDEGKMDTYSIFSKNTAPYSEFITPVRGFSTEVVDQITAQIPHVDLLLIDGDHSYAGVKADWEAYKHLLRPGSTVVFHDWGWAEGVKQVIEEDAKPLMTSFDSLPNMWWGTL